MDNSISLLTGRPYAASNGYNVAREVDDVLRKALDFLTTSDIFNAVTKSMNFKDANDYISGAVKGRLDNLYRQGKIERNEMKFHTKGWAGSTAVYRWKIKAEANTGIKVYIPEKTPDLIEEKKPDLEEPSSETTNQGLVTQIDNQMTQTQNSSNPKSNSRLTKEIKMERMIAYVATLIKSIQAGIAFKFNDQARAHNLRWSPGTKAIRSILSYDMRLIEQVPMKKGENRIDNLYKFTPKNVDKVWDEKAIKNLARKLVDKVSPGNYQRVLKNDKKKHTKPGKKNSKKVAPVRSTVSRLEASELKEQNFFAAPRESSGHSFFAEGETLQLTGNDKLFLKQLLGSGTINQLLSPEGRASAASILNKLVLIQSRPVEEVDDVDEADELPKTRTNLSKVPVDLPLSKLVRYIFTLNSQALNLDQIKEQVVLLNPAMKFRLGSVSPSLATEHFDRTVKRPGKPMFYSLKPGHEITEADFGK